MNVLPVPRSVYGGYFVHVLAVYLQCTSPVHHPLPPVITSCGRSPLETCLYFLSDSGPLFYFSAPTPTHVFTPALPATATAEGAPKFTPPLIAKLSMLGDIELSVRLEQDSGQGLQISLFYNPVITKLVMHRRDRTEALRVSQKTLEITTFVSLMPITVLPLAGGSTVGWIERA